MRTASLLPITKDQRPFVLKSLLYISYVTLMTSTGLFAQSDQLVEDFEGYNSGDYPTEWKFLDDKNLVPVSPSIMYPEIKFEIGEEAGNHFLRAHVKDRYHRIILENGSDLEWDLAINPVLEWDWRALKLPQGANELRGRKNDTGAAVYIYFDKKDFFGRPRTIKYTFSSSQEVGKTKRYGALKLIVASTASQGSNEWIHVRRNVVEDYERLFGKKPKGNPILLALWSDSDNMDETAIVDFDNIRLTN